jgi:hypothetical protein
MRLPSKQKAIFYLAAVFLTGLLTGLGVGYAVSEKTPRRFPRPQDKASSFVERLRGDLQLTEQQAAQIQPAFDELGKELNTLHTNAIERVSAMIRKTHQDIEVFLNPQQVEKLRRIQQERELKFREHADRNRQPPELSHKPAPD